jgi:hypothetical protein
MKRTVWTFGLISGGILSAMMVLTIPFADTIGFDKAEILGYTTMIAAGLLIYFGVRSYRDNVAGGSVRFGRALGVGCLICLVSSVCYVATWQVVFKEISPDFMAKYQAHTVETAKANGESPEAIQKKIADFDKFAELYSNPFIRVAITFVEPLPVGLIIALISAGILSRKRREDEYAVQGGRALTSNARSGPA